MRWNQDSQREEDQRRMNEIIGYLTKLRLNPEKMEKLKQKEVNLIVQNFVSILLHSSPTGLCKAI